MQGESVNVLVGAERTQFSVPKLLLFHHSKVAQCTFVQHGGDVHFKEFDENALCLPEHAPETFEFVLIWMYQRQLGIREYCQTVFNSHDKKKQGLEAGFLLLCRVYILADYLDIDEIKDLVMSELDEILWRNEGPDFPIGADAVKAVFQNTVENSQIYKFVLEKLAESLVHHSDARPIEEYAECFSEIAGFGTLIMKRVLEIHVGLRAKSDLQARLW